MPYKTFNFQFKNLREQLELCPTCVYVVSLMGNHFKLIDHSNKIKSSNRCLLCDTSSAKDYKVREDLKGIISDIEPYKNVSKLRSFRLCGGCFHFIHYSKIYSRNLLKKYVSIVESSGLDINILNNVFTAVFIKNNRKNSTQSDRIDQTPIEIREVFR